jgi:Zn-finger nucleic acid-binding protein
VCHRRGAGPRADAWQEPARAERRAPGLGTTLLQSVTEVLGALGRGALRGAVYDQRVDGFERWVDHERDSEARQATFAAGLIASGQARGRVTMRDQPDGGPWTCPRTGDALEARTVAGVHMHVNPTCGGLMLERASEGHLRAHPELWPEVRAAADALEAQATLQLDGRALAYLTCPRCGGPMARRAFERVSGVVVDECPRHGVWFDAGELSQALTFLERGGEARRAAFEARERAHLEEQRRRMPKPTSRFDGGDPW